MAELALASSEAPQFDAAFRSGVRRASGLAARRAPFSSRRVAGRGDARRALRPCRACAIGRQLPADPLRARRRRGAPRRGPGQFRGRQPPGARRLSRRAGGALRQRSSSRACATRRSSWRCSATRRPSRATASARAPCRRRGAIRPSARCTRSGSPRAPAGSASAGCRSSIPAGIAEALDVPRAWAFIGYLCVGWPQEEHLIPELERAGWQARERASGPRR